MMKRLPILVALALPMLLAGCSGGGSPAATESAAANPPEVAKAFGDCLTAEGVAGVFVDDEGYVGVRFEVASDGSVTGGDGPAPNADAQKKCQDAVPAYHERSVADDPELAADFRARALDFAACARANGLADFPDPDTSASDRLMVPAGTTKAQFLAVVTACAQVLAPASGSGSGEPESDDGGAVTLSIPDFGGAYDPSWSTDVMAIIFGDSGAEVVAR